MSVQGKIAEGGQIAEQTAPGVSELTELAARVAVLPTYDGNDLGCKLYRVDLPTDTAAKAVPVLLIRAEHRSALVRACRSHDALVKALEDIAAFSQSRFAVDRAQGALASAREVQS